MKGEWRGAVKMRYREGQIDSNDRGEPQAPGDKAAFSALGGLGDFVVETANITVAAIFLYRRIKNLLRRETAVADQEPEG